MEERRDARLLDQDVGDPLEPLAIDALAQRLALGIGRPHRRRAILELATDAVGLHGLLVAIPADALDADLGHVAAETAVAVEEGRPSARSGGREGCAEAAGAAADDQHVGLVDDVDGTGRLLDLARHLD